MKHGSGKFPKPAGAVPQPLTARTNHHLQCSADSKEQTDDCMDASKYTDLARSYWLAKFATMIMWGDLHGAFNIILSPHTLFLALTGRKILSYLTWLVKFMSETPGFMCLFLCKYTFSPKEGTTAFLSTKHLVTLWAPLLIHQPHN